MWVYLLGGRAQADQFRATVRIFLPSSDDDCEEEMLYRGKVNALDSPARQRPTEVAGLTFPDFVAKRFWKNRLNNEFAYIVQ